MRLRQQLLTKNECYIAGKTIKPKGVMVHSTGANNPRVSRYVPGDKEIGSSGSPRWNTYHAGGKDIGPHKFVKDPKTGHCKTCGGSKKCVHAFIGKFSDGEVGTVQTLPWNRRGWHGASGKKGSANNTHIGFEICEDGLIDPKYFRAVYQEAVELTAYLCQKYGLDPLADGVVICHQEGYRRGIASNHGDVLHWFPRHGKSMDDFRADVARTMKGEDDMTEAEVKKIVREVLDQTMELDSYRMFVQDMEKYRQELGKLPEPEWARKTGEWDKAFSDGIIADKSRPQDLCTKAEAAAMALRAAEGK